MPSPKKGSPEAKAWAAKMKAAREQKSDENVAVEATTAPEVQTQGVTLTQEQFQAMLDRLQTLENAVATPQTPGANNVQLGPQGQVMGIIERFSVDPTHYEDPTEALYDLPTLRRHAMRENYELRFLVKPVRYQTAQGTWYAEPRFELTLLKRDYDTQGNEFRKIVLGRANFFEDPPANIEEASLAGLTLEELHTNPSEFARKMRFYRYSFWLNEILNPSPPEKATSRKTQAVIGGRAYEIEEYSKPVE